jgi:Tubulin-tyrosine ligase family
VEAFAYMRHQRSDRNFEFFGLDIIPDTNGICWLIEINRLPGLESSKNNKEQEDIFYNEMMDQLLNIVLKPLFPLECVDEFAYSSNWAHVHKPSPTLDSHASVVPISSSNPDCYANTLRWKMFTRKVRGNVVVEFMS